MKDDLLIRKLTISDAPALSGMLLTQPGGYITMFAPFPFNLPAITALLTRAQRDAFFGIFHNDQLAAFFMLRGWDEGYQTPAYGVVIDQLHSRKGLGQLTLEFCKAYCRLQGCRQIMLKVHPENHAARHIYEKAGFVQTGVDPKNANLVYHHTLRETGSLP